MIPKLKIALDYDGTYSADPRLWDLFIEHAQQLGHEVVIVTMRYPEEAIWHGMPCEIFYTSRQGKKRFMENMGYEFDIWIDDNPMWILESTNEAKWPADAMEQYKCETIDCKFPKRDPEHTHCPSCAGDKR
jgi:hypothetical protein